MQQRARSVPDEGRHGRHLRRRAPPHFGIQAAEGAFEREASVVDATEGKIRERANEAGGKACLGVVAFEKRGGEIACALRVAGVVGKLGLRDGRDQKQDWAYRASAEELRALTALHNDDNLLPGVERCVLVEGDVFESVPRFLRENPGLRIALLYCDLDLYGPTKFCLEHFYPLVVNGGIVCFDEYGLIPWEGESRAVDEFLAEHRLSPRLRRFPFSPSPCGYFVKGENPEPAHPGMPRR